MLEKTIEKYFVKRVEALGGITYKFRSITNAGVADRIACLPDGTTWFIEIKTIGGKVSALQAIHARHLQQLKQKYACLWSKEDVDSWANAL